MLPNRSKNSPLPRTRSNERLLDMFSWVDNMSEINNELIAEEEDNETTSGGPDDGIDNETYAPELPPKESTPNMSSVQNNQDDRQDTQSDNYRDDEQGRQSDNYHDDRQDRQSDNRSRNSDQETMSYVSSQSELETSMPSHVYKELRGLPSNNALKQNMRKTLKERRPKSRAKLQTNGEEGFSVDNEAVVANEEEVFHGMDFSPEEYAAFMGRQNNLKEMPTSIRRKRNIKHNLHNDVTKKTKIKHISAWKHFTLTTAMGWQHFKDACSEVYYVMDLWRGHLKTIQGVFGTGVLSYFILLRWLFLINLVAFFCNIFFLFIPQMVYAASFKSNSASFGGWELLTGDGYFTSSELYYGAYTNQSIPMGNGMIYKMPLAYLCLGGGYLLLCLAIMVYSMAESYRENYIYAGDEFSFYTAKAFCSWDYGITDAESATLKTKSIFNDLKEVIAEHMFEEDRTTQEICCLVFIRCLTNLLVLGMIGGGSFLIYYTATMSFEVGALEVKKLLFPIIVSVLNLVLPMTFRIITSLEQYQHPKTSIQINLARTVLLKMTTIAVILVSLFTDVTKCRTTGKNTLSGGRCLLAMKQCWETYIGISFYRLIVVDFIFLLLSTFVGEFVRSVIATYIGWCGRNVGYPGFDISRNVLDLVYGQTLAWIGTFFSPLLSVVNVIKLLLLFYVKRISVVQNCKASGRPFLAAKMNLLFLSILAVSFVVSITTVGYTVMSQTEELLQPSAACGPFRGKDRMYSVITDEIEHFPWQLKTAIQYISSSSFLTLIFCILGIIVYYYKMLKDSNEKKIKLLKNQIALAGQDKLFLMQKITSGTGFHTTVDDGQ